MLLGTQDKDFFPKNMTEKFQYIKEMGFDCFEIDGKVLVENVEEVKKAVEENRISSVRYQNYKDIATIIKQTKKGY